MPTTIPIEILLQHDPWATRNILDACAKLTPEQFHRRFEMGPGSLHDTTNHILGAMQRWGDMLAGRESGPRLEETRRSPAELVLMLDRVATDFAAAARAHDPLQSVTGMRHGKSLTLPRVSVITHVATHGVHHRAQCLNMLRQIGVTPLPASSVMEWVVSVDLSR